MVVAVAVELDGETMLGPPAVDVAPTRETVRHRERQIMRTEQLQELALESAERDVNVPPENSAQRRRTRARWTTVQDAFDFSGRRPVANAGLVTNARKLALVKRRREVDERSSHGRHRDATPRSAVENAGFRLSRRDALNSAFGRGRDVRRRCQAPDKTEVVAGCLTAQESSVAASKHSGHVPSVSVWSAVADAIDAPELEQQRARCKALANLGARYPSVEQLPTCNDAVLHVGNPGDLEFCRPVVVPHHGP